MAAIQIKPVSDRAHAELRRRADASGQSLQQYLLKMLDEQVEHRSLDEWLDSLPVDAEPVSMEEIVEFVRTDRAHH